MKHLFFVCDLIFLSKDDAEIKVIFLTSSMIWTVIFLEDLGKLYSHFFESWIVNQNKNIKQKIIVNYEDLLDKEKREVFYDTVSKKFDINLNILTDPISLAGQVYQSENYSKKDFDNYNVSSKLQLNKENLIALNSNLNDLIFDTLGYKKVV